MTVQYLKKCSPKHSKILIELNIVLLCKHAIKPLYISTQMSKHTSQLLVT